MFFPLLDLPEELLMQVLGHLDRTDIDNFRLLNHSCAKLALPQLYHRLVVACDRHGMRLLGQIRENGRLKYVRELSFTAPMEFLPYDVLPNMENSKWRYVDECRYSTYSHLQPFTAAAREIISDVLQSTRLRALSIHYPCLCRRVERNQDGQQLYLHSITTYFDLFWTRILEKACLNQLQHLELDQPEFTKLMKCPHQDGHCRNDPPTDFYCVPLQLFQGLRSLTLRLRWSTEDTQDLGCLPYEFVRASPDIKTLVLSFREDNGLDLKTLDEIRMYRYDHYYRITSPLDENIISHRLENLTLHGLTVPEMQLRTLFAKLRDSLRNIQIFYSRLTDGHWRNVFQSLLACPNLHEWQAVGLEVCARTARPSGDYRMTLKGVLHGVRLRELEMYLSSQSTECWFAYGQFLREINRRRAILGLRVHRVHRHQATSPPMRWPMVPYDPSLAWLPYPHLSIKDSGSEAQHQSLDYILSGKIRFRGLYSYAELEAQGFLEEQST